MTLSVDGLNSLTNKGIESKGGVRDAVFKNHAYLNRLKPKQGVWDGAKMTFPFEYMDDTSAPGGFYRGAAALSLDMYDPYTELSFELIELEKTLVITKRDLALNSGSNGRIKLLEKRLKSLEKALRQLFTKGIYSDGTVSTGALSADQFVGQQAFLKSSAVNYGNVTSTDISVHIAYVNDNSGTNRALTTALHQAAIGGASEGEEKPTVGIMRQNVMDKFIELIKPHQRTIKEGSLDGMGHAKNTLVYSGVDHIVDNLSSANSIVFLNEKFVRLWTHPDHDMNVESFDKLEATDAIAKRIFYKGAYVCEVLRYQSWLKDLTV
jgi:hypothetical protein